MENNTESKLNKVRSYLLDLLKYIKKYKFLKSSAIYKKIKSTGIYCYSPTMWNDETEQEIIELENLNIITSIDKINKELETCMNSSYFYTLKGNPYNIRFNGQGLTINK